MDIRDVKEEPPNFNDKGLEMMFTLQEELLDGYIKVESLPQYPISIHTADNQIILKDFIARIVEELGEAYESYELMLNMYEAVIIGKEKASDLETHLQNFNEEIGDSLHFFLELLLYCDFDTADIETFYNKYVIQEELRGSRYIPTNDLLRICFGIANWYNQREMGPTAHSTSFKFSPDNNALYMRAGRKLSLDYDVTMRGMLWNITYQLQMLRNTLKNKPWKQSEMMTDENKFNNIMMSAWFHYFIFLQFVGFDAETLFCVYFKKNVINQFRIKSKY